MNELADIRLAVARVGRIDNARIVQWRLIKHLELLGFECRKEVPADYFNGLRIRAGKTDVLASRDGQHIAIEIDRNSPREKSILKLRGLHVSQRVIVLRNQPKRACPYLQGIDAVYVLGEYALNESGVRG